MVRYVAGSGLPAIRTRGGTIAEEIREGQGGIGASAKPLLLTQKILFG